MKDIRNDARTVKVGAKGELAKYTLWRRPALKRLYAVLLVLRLMSLVHKLRTISCTP
jgi:hypothetical protein